MTKPTSLVWLRRDLRLEDNSALIAAAERGGAVVPVFIWEPGAEAPWQPGAASRWWLQRSLASLDEQLRRRGSRLIYRIGESCGALAALLQESGADAVYWNRLYEPTTIARDQQIKSALRASGATAESFNSQLLFEPWEIQTGAGKPYQVFTPFWRACLAATEPAEPRDCPKKLLAPSAWPVSQSLAELKLEPTIAWDAGLRTAWEPGTAGAADCFSKFVASRVSNYSAQRDFPADVGTSRLSPHLHFGEISPHTLWHTVRLSLGPDWKTEAADAGAKTFLKELVWREFAHHLLFHFPQTANAPLRADFAKFPWQKNDVGLRAWQSGLTGYPIVDAGMRELWHTGWMHNRVRMIVASFLVKDLRIAWQTGAKWFWDTLVDADLANNTLGWQWSAGCGADAAPYFRIFNPVLQSEKFDARGTYLRRWLPELSRLPDKWIHKPWQAPVTILQSANVELGQTYPGPIVDHDSARKQALIAFKSLRGE